MAIFHNTIWQHWLKLIVITLLILMKNKHSHSVDCFCYCNTSSIKDKYRKEKNTFDTIQCSLLYWYVITWLAMHQINKCIIQIELFWILPLTKPYLNKSNLGDAITFLYWWSTNVFSTCNVFQIIIVISSFFFFFSDLNHFQKYLHWSSKVHL